MWRPSRPRLAMLVVLLVGIGSPLVFVRQALTASQPKKGSASRAAKPTDENSGAPVIRPGVPDANGYVTHILPELSRCVLTDGQHQYAAQNAARGPEDPQPVDIPVDPSGGMRLSLEERRISAFRDGRLLWRVEAPGKWSLHLAGFDPVVACFVGYTGSENDPTVESPPRVHRLDLTTGKWLPDLELSGSGEIIETALVGPRRIV